MRKKGKLLVDINAYADIPRPEKGQILDRIEEYLDNGELSEALLSFSGLPGVGKSHVAKAVYDELQKKSFSERTFSVYTDISDCADEIEVYYKLATARSGFLKAHPMLEAQQEYLNQFMQIHDWIYGSMRKNTQIKEYSEEKAIKEIVKLAVEQMSKGVGAIAAAGSYMSPEWAAAFKGLNVIIAQIPYAKFTKGEIQLAVQDKKDRHVAQLFQDILDALREKNKREELFRLLLAKSFDNKDKDGVELFKSVIILDNFQLEQNNDLGRDQSWLSMRGRLMDTVEAMWIIVSRRPTAHLFTRVIPLEGMYPEIDLPGFSEEQARLYLTISCPRLESMSETEYEDVLTRMLEVCVTDNIYLPYLLRLLAQHYRRLAADPARDKIEPQDFVQTENEEEIFGYYFYKDMSDLMINAFQILSCLAVWDDFWIEQVRMRFDNHLLNAKCVLANSAPLETEGDKFKLHEAVKDGLYRSPQNYIKRDVLRYFYEIFQNTYTESMTDEQKRIWYQAERMQTLAELTYDYLDIGLVKLESMEAAFDKIYGDNKNRGDISDGFIRFYSQYIDKLGEESDVPFLHFQNQDLENQEERKKEISENIKGLEYQENCFPAIRTYLAKCFNLADLYTYSNHADNALRLEQLILYFCEQLLKRLQEQNTPKHETLECAFWCVKALNAIAFDSSQEHLYDEAYARGKEGLQKLPGLANELKENLNVENQPKKDVEKTFKMLLNPENAKEFWIDSGMEMSSELFNKIVDFYEWLIKIDTKKDSVGGVLKTLLTVTYMKLRGNYPWYQIKEEQIIAGTEEKIWKYGARTYWMRTAILRAEERKGIGEGRQNALRLDVLRSQHNICVYLYKLGEIEKATILENEVIRKSEQTLSREKFRTEKQARFDALSNRLEENRKSGDKTTAAANGDISLLLWEREGVTTESMKNFFETPDIVSEQMQYLGDYYLHLGWYAMALRQFSTVLLRRSVSYGLNDGKSMDTLMRLYLAAFAQKDKELLPMLEEYISMRTDKTRRIETDSKGILLKVNCLRDILEIANGDGAREDKLRKMLDRIDE